MALGRGSRDGAEIWPRFGGDGGTPVVVEMAFQRHAFGLYAQSAAGRGPRRRVQKQPETIRSNQKQ